MIEQIKRRVFTTFFHLFIIKAGLDAYPIKNSHIEIYLQSFIRSSCVNSQTREYSQIAGLNTAGENPTSPKPRLTRPIPDLTGKVAIVTGTNTGLTDATAVSLAAYGARVFLAYRIKQRAEDVIERARVEIKATYPNVLKSPQREFLELDVNDMNKTHQAAKEFLSKELPLHILVNTSGIMNTPFALGADGIEAQFAVNHMGHFVFTTTLLDRIKESQLSRIVNFSAMGHELLPSKMNGIDFDTLNDEGDFSSLNRYSRSKLDNILLAKALARRMGCERVYVDVAHPGLVATEIGRSSKDMIGAAGDKAGQLLNAVLGYSAEEGALTQLYLATSPDRKSGCEGKILYSHRK